MRPLHRLLAFALLLSALIAPAKAQFGNLMSFDSRLMHYGIRVGYTQSKFDITPTNTDSIRQALLTANSYHTAGFHIAVICDMRLTNFFNLRLMPGITLVDRKIDYSWNSTYLATHPLAEMSRTVESVYGDIPLEIKFRAWRWNDLRPYVTAGGSYSFDFSSLRKNKNNNQESIIRLNPNEWRYTIGVGVDVFLHYVKFAIELKTAIGLTNLQTDGNEIYDHAVDHMRSRTFMLSFTFEG